jgi:hypothetical protein
MLRRPKHSKIEVVAPKEEEEEEEEEKEEKPNISCNTINMRVH